MEYEVERWMRDYYRVPEQDDFVYVCMYASYSECSLPPGRGSVGALSVVQGSSG